MPIFTPLIALYIYIYLQASYLQYNFHPKGTARRVEKDLSILSQGPNLSPYLIIISPFTPPSSSPPSLLRRRLPLHSSVVVSPFAPLLSSPPSLLHHCRQGPPSYIAPTDTLPDAKYQTHHNLYYNQSIAIRLQTTSVTCLQLLGCRQPPQPVYSY